MKLLFLFGAAALLFAFAACNNPSGSGLQEPQEPLEPQGDLFTVTLICEYGLVLPVPVTVLVNPGDKVPADEFTDDAFSGAFSSPYGASPNGWTLAGVYVSPWEIPITEDTTFHVRWIWIM